MDLSLIEYREEWSVLPLVKRTFLYK